jgi:hypothetical protein
VISALLQIGVAETTGIAAIALAALGLVGLIYRTSQDAMREERAAHREERKQLTAALEGLTTSSKTLYDLLLMHVGRPGAQ